MTMKVQSVAEAEEYLLRYSPTKSASQSYTLECMVQMMDRLDNPQQQLKLIHIAGTSGKTSTAYFIRNLLEAYGKKTGLTVSPHIENITERIQIGGKPMPERKFLNYLNDFLGIVDQWRDLKPSYFELLIALSYWVLTKEEVDYAVIEVGLGGLLDATNVVKRNDKVCVLTPIGLDHTRVLGATLTEIAAQKAGIITINNAVFSSEQPQDVKRIFDTAAANNKTMVRYSTPSGDDGSLIPLFQQQNWQLACDVVDYIALRDDILQPDTNLRNRTILHGPPGRYERYRVGNKTLILDGAHNPQKLLALTHALEHEFAEPVAMLVGFIDAPDNKIEACLNIVAQFSSTLILTEFSRGQDIRDRHSASIAALEGMIQAQNISCRTMSNPTQAVQELLQLPEDILVVTGSLYLVALLRPLLRDMSPTKEGLL